MRKKTLLCFVMLTLVLCAVGAQPARAQLTDVPNDHWAYQAVATLVNKGYLPVYEDGTFQGTRAVDRYTLAVTLARILDDIEAGRVQGSIDDLSLIQELTTEFREELVVWYADREEVASKLAAVEAQMITTDDRLNRVVSAQTALQEEVEQLKNELLVEAEQRQSLSSEQETALAGQQQVISTQQAQLDEQGQAIQEQLVQLNAHTALLDEQQVRLDELLSAVVALEDTLLEHSGAIGSLENWAGEKSAVMATLQMAHEEQEKDITTLRLSLDEMSVANDNRLSELEGELLAQLEASATSIQQLNQRSQELEKDLQNVAVLLQRETQKRSELTAHLEGMQKDLVDLEAEIGLSEEEFAQLSKQISSEIDVQMNAALIREQRLERQIDELQSEFASYREEAEAKQKSSKTMSTIALVVGVLGAAIGFIGN